MLAAKSAILLHLHTVRRILFIFLRVIVTLFAHCAGKRNSITNTCFRHFDRHLRVIGLESSHKKRAFLDKQTNNITGAFIYQTNPPQKLLK